MRQVRQVRHHRDTESPWGAWDVSFVSLVSLRDISQHPFRSPWPPRPRPIRGYVVHSQSETTATTPPKTLDYMALPCLNGVRQGETSETTPLAETLARARKPSPA